MAFGRSGHSVSTPMHRVARDDVQREAWWVARHVSRAPRWSRHACCRWPACPPLPWPSLHRRRPTDSRVQTRTAAVHRRPHEVPTRGRGRTPSRKRRTRGRPIPRPATRIGATGAAPPSIPGRVAPRGDPRPPDPPSPGPPQGLGEIPARPSLALRSPALRSPAPRSLARPSLALPSPGRPSPALPSPGRPSPALPSLALRSLALSILVRPSLALPSR